MKTFAKLWVLLTACLSGCAAMEPGPAINDNGGGKRVQLLVPQESGPPLRRMAVRWQNFMVMLRGTNSGRSSLQKETDSETHEVFFPAPALPAEVKSPAETPPATLLAAGTLRPAIASLPKTSSGQSVSQAKVSEASLPAEVVSTATSGTSEKPGADPVSVWRAREAN
jgi:hypothetical protein